jgi:hypothetical protein
MPVACQHCRLLSLASPGHQAPLSGVSGGFSAILQLEFVEDIVDVVLDRLHLDTQMDGDFFVAEPPFD